MGDNIIELLCLGTAAGQQDDSISTSTTCDIFAEYHLIVTSALELAVVYAYGLPYHILSSLCSHSVCPWSLILHL